MFRRTYDTGIAHGTVTVIINTEHFEVTTYRIEEDYSDHRRPDGVSFVDDIMLDLSRRDFTMNAMAYHPKKGFVDPYNGQHDIAKQCIKSVRNANERFTEDALRILRAVRFASQLNFEIEPNTQNAIVELRHLLTHISKERIRDEFTKILQSNKVKNVILLHQLKLTQYISLELSQFLNYDNFYDDKILEITQKLPNDIVLRYSSLLYLIGLITQSSYEDKENFGEHSSKMAKKVLKELKWDNKTIKEVSLILKYYFYDMPKCCPNKIYIKKLLGIMEQEILEKMLLLKETELQVCYNNSQLQIIQEIREVINTIKVRQECYKIKDLAITGDDLIKLGVPRGKEIGDKLSQTLEYVLKNPDKNTKEELRGFLSL